MKTNGDEPANPIYLESGLKYNSHIESGLTKREYFAAMAMQGLIISQGEKNIVNNWGVDGERISENAVHIANELLKQLDKD